MSVLRYPFLAVFVACCCFGSDNCLSKHAVEKVLEFAPLVTNTMQSDAANDIDRAVFKEIMHGDYGAGLALLLQGIEQYPRNFGLQARLASLVGDYAGNFSGELNERMLHYSRALFDKLFDELDGQTKDEYFFFKNEYFFRFGHYKQQYELGLEKFAYYWGTEDWHKRAASCYYTQGVGAANYAKQLLVEGDAVLAEEYAQKALLAWAQYFTHNNDYYNSYVHYALALAILGHKEEMMHALLQSAYLIGKDLSFHEFKDVIDFFETTLVIEE